MCFLHAVSGCQRGPTRILRMFWGSSSGQESRQPVWLWFDSQWLPTTSLEINIFSWRTLCPATSSVRRTKLSNIMFQLWALAISDIFHILRRLTVDSLGFHHDTIHWKRSKQVNLRCKATRLVGTTCGAEEVFIVHSSPASYNTGKNYREFGKYISCGNKNIPPDKMSGRSKVVSDKTEFLNFQPDKCPMSGAISRLGQSDNSTKPRKYMGYQL